MGANLIPDTRPEECLAAGSVLSSPDMPSTSSTSSTSDDKAATESPVETPPATKLSNYPIIPRSELRVLEQLGAGTYGSVFRGIWTPAQQSNGSDVGDTKDSKWLTVALKKVFMLEKEVDILSQIRHRNIIQFFGVSHANPDFYIVTGCIFLLPARTCAILSDIQNTPRADRSMNIYTVLLQRCPSSVFLNGQLRLLTELSTSTTRRQLQ